VTVTNALGSDDTEIMAAALNALGIAVTRDAGAKTMQVFGQGGRIPARSAALSVGNAGTAARFLTALCAAAPDGVYQLDGVPQMRKRPIRGLLAALRRLGADIRCLAAEGCFPFEIHAHGLRGDTVTVDASESSQMLSALMMTAPLANAPIAIRVPGRIVSEPFVAMTWDMMQGFGIDRDLMRRNAARDFLLSPAKYSRPSGRFEVEIDATAASYFAALPIVVGDTSKLRIRGLITSDQTLQGDFKFIELLYDNDLILYPGLGKAPEPLVASNRRKGFTADFSKISDTFLTLAAIAPLLAGPTRITGIGHTRKQETDRVAGVARELEKLGQKVEVKPDALTITPDLGELRRRAAGGPIDIETYDDHRFAMSFAILGCHNLRGDGKAWLRIRNPGCCAKTFPDFFAVLEQVRQNSCPSPPRDTP
jgi:3-phosphoshikimate 1-carboxyvinyltransferase